MGQKQIPCANDRKKGKDGQMRLPETYSTVTDLARFLGWSTSQPRRTAM